MPYIKADVSVELTKEKEIHLKEKLGAMIETIPGKTEAFLMIQFRDKCCFYFSGNQDAPAAYVKVEVFGEILNEYSQNMTSMICDLLNEELDIPKSRTYVTYEGITQWGCNGKNF